MDVQHPHPHPHAPAARDEHALEPARTFARRIDCAPPPRPAVAVQHGYGRAPGEAA
ncbi:MAG TPA: hypothetical protein VHG08_16610 [Longimicrobium sp.]|nr:hypothetical protein [Longimicrobium sp.]